MGSIPVGTTDVKPIEKNVEIFLSTLALFKNRFTFAAAFEKKHSGRSAAR
jgi:hypothetical protein